MKNSNRKSTVHHLFPLNVHVQEKNFTVKYVLLVKITPKYSKEQQFGSHKMYMSHQSSFVHHFSL